MFSPFITLVRRKSRKVEEHENMEFSGIGGPNRGMLRERVTATLNKQDDEIINFLFLHFSRFLSLSLLLTRAVLFEVGANAPQREFATTKGALIIWSNYMFVPSF